MAALVMVHPRPKCKTECREECFVTVNAVDASGTWKFVEMLPMESLAELARAREEM